MREKLSFGSWFEQTLQLRKRSTEEFTQKKDSMYIYETCGKSFKQKASLHVHKSFLFSRINAPYAIKALREKQELDKIIFSFISSENSYSCDACGK